MDLQCPIKAVTINQSIKYVLQDLFRVVRLGVLHCTLLV